MFIEMTCLNEFLKKSFKEYTDVCIKLKRFSDMDFSEILAHFLQDFFLIQNKNLEEFLKEFQEDWKDFDVFWIFVVINIINASGTFGMSLSVWYELYCKICGTYSRMKTILKF